MEKSLSSTLEDYLEAIYRLEKEKRSARVRDIASLVGVTKSTVTSALKSLATKGLVNHEPYELVTLTPSGKAVAAEIVTSHQVLHHFLKDILLLDNEKAEIAACRMEHAVDRPIIERLACFLTYVRKHIDVEGSWIEDFRDSVRHGSENGTCRDCEKDCMTRFMAESE